MNLALFGEEDAPLWRTAVVDPPWTEAGGGGRGAQNHYPLLRTDQMPAVVRRSGLWRPFPHAHLYLWVTNNYLEDGLWLMRELGFRPVTKLTWVKVDAEVALAELGEDDLRQGLGQYFRGEDEVLLFGVHGQGMHPSVYRERKDLGTVILAPHVRGPDGRVVHSAKPPEAFERVEARSRGPYCEFFARGPARPGWRSWGNEAEPSLELRP